MIKKNDNTISKLTYKGKDIIIIGTSHLSKKSVETVAVFIKKYAPETVCIELCKSRFDKIQQENRWKDMDIIKVIKNGQIPLLLSSLLLASYQKRMGKNIGIAPGQEMMQAISSANKINSPVELVDRELRISLLRAWRLMGILEKIKIVLNLVTSIIESDDMTEREIEEIKQNGMLERIISEFNKSMPKIKEVLIDERNQYLTEKIRSANGKKIIAVVGLGHIPGIKLNWDKTINITKLEELPPKGKIMTMLKWFIPMGIGLLMIYGFKNGGIEKLLSITSWWILANCVFSGLGSLIALAHPITIILSILTAPITSLSPIIASGWIAGLIEAYIRKPKIKDVEALSEDIMSIKGFWKNRITRITLVVIFTNVGSMIGTILAIPMII